MDLTTYARELGENARAASRVLRAATKKRRNDSLKALAGQIRARAKTILAANARDVEDGKAWGLSSAMIDRLLLNPARLESVAASVEDIARLPDPLNRLLDSHTRRDGLRISRVSVPIGAVLFIYESRPNVTIDGAALCLKSGNAVILRGGKEAARTNAAFGACVRMALASVKLPEAAAQVVNTPDRALLDMLLRDEAHIDLVIPRGGENLIRAVVEKARIPVIKHYKGLCHTYVDRSADPEAALNIVINAKTQRPGVCNAMETLLLDRHLKPRTGWALLKALSEKGVELCGDAESRRLSEAVKPATDENYDTEYLDLKCSVRVVDGVKGAIAHIARHGTGHTDAVVARSPKVQKAFKSEVESASVMINASTRFADGGEYGLGAEVGISTDKLHARGPMGLESLTTYQWIVEGSGHVRR
jgi:glutamate-5-semialdehyde dehydrogenase